MYKKACCTCKVVVLRNKPIAFLTSWLPSPSSLLSSLFSLFHSLHVGQPGQLARLQGSNSVELFKFHDFFHDLFKFSKALGLAVSLKHFKTFPCCRVFFDLKQFNRPKLQCPPRCVPFALLITPLYLTLSSAVTNLSNKTLIFYDFQGPTTKFHNLPGLENEILKFHDFPGFP